MRPKAPKKSYIKSKNYTSRARETEGVVFTQKSTAEIMIQEALQARLRQSFPDLSTGRLQHFFDGELSQSTGAGVVREILRWRFLDPAVGEGIFLASIQNIIPGLVRKYSLSLPDNWRRTHLSGYDIDRNMVERCKARLSSPVTLFQSDFLLDKPHNLQPDIIIANPPYVRQELIDKKYKHKLIEKTRSLFSAEGIGISARSDLYLYFILHGLYQLKQNGVLTMIIPNGWMDNDYGTSLRQLLLHHFQICSILDQSRRHFDEEVNTVILTVCKQKPAAKRKIVCRTDDHKTTVVSSELKSINLGWYGSIFRTPDWLREFILSSPRLVTLESLFQIQTGIITGNNKRYYSEVRRSDNDIPAIRSPKMVSKLMVSEKEISTWIQSVGVPYKIRRAPILWPDLRGSKHWVVWNRDNLPYEHTFYGLLPRENQPVNLNMILMLNSTWVWLMMELYGRKNLGGGALRMVKRDLVHLPVPSLRSIDIPPRVVQSLIRRPVYSWRDELDRDDRARLDEAVFAYLGISDRLNSCRNVLKSLMTWREKKAGIPRAAQGTA